MNDIIPGIKRVIMLKNGRIFIDGTKEKVLTEKNLSGLFGSAVKLVKTGDVYTAF